MSICSKDSSLHFLLPRKRNNREALASELFLKSCKVLQSKIQFLENSMRTTNSSISTSELYLVISFCPASLRRDVHHQGDLRVRPSLSKLLIQKQQLTSRHMIQSEVLSQPLGEARTLFTKLEKLKFFRSISRAVSS